MLFSIIIPIYNAEKSIGKCLNSILVQTFDDYEVIMINDGSIDDSVSICKSFIEIDARFKLVSQENKGPSAARNAGLRLANGDYVCFVDSDDYIVSTYLEQLYWKIIDQKPDVVFLGYFRINVDTRMQEEYIPPTNMRGVELLAELSNQDMFGYTWSKCIKRSVIGDVQFREDIRLFEDEVFTCTICRRTESIDVLPQLLYYYVCGLGDTLIGKTYQEYCILTDRVFYEWEKFACKNSGWGHFLQQKANIYVDRCKYYGIERNVDKKAFFTSLANTRIFRLHTNRDALDFFIQHRLWVGVMAVVCWYRLRTCVAGFLKSKKY